MSGNCIKCGLEIKESFSFCPSCGEPVAIHSDTSQKNHNISSNQKMEYIRKENGEEVFFLHLILGKGESAKRVKSEHAKGNGARLCNNGIVAMEQLIKEGYTFKNVEMAMKLGTEFDLNDKDCEILEPDVIVKLYKAYSFFNILGYSYRWKELPESIRFIS